LWLGREVGEVGAERAVDLSGDIAFEAAHDLALTLELDRVPRRLG
jgi:hypothetical protein